VANYREGYNLFACNGILFNHESPRRGETFVSRKITRAIASIIAKKQKRVHLGNLDSKRDWGYAPEYVEVMWNMIQNDKPEDIVIGTGQNHTVKEFVKEAFEYVGLDWEKYVGIDPRYFRPTEVDELNADSSKSKTIFGWDPKIKFNNLVWIMMDADMRKLGLDSPGKGDKVLNEKFPDRWWKVD